MNENSQKQIEDAKVKLEKEIDISSQSVVYPEVLTQQVQRPTIKKKRRILLILLILSAILLGINFKWPIFSHMFIAYTYSLLPLKSIQLDHLNKYVNSMQQEYRESFNKGAKKQIEHSECYEGTVGLWSSPGYCHVDYKIVAEPSENIGENQQSIKDFYDLLMSKNWEGGTLYTTKSWRDTFIPARKGNELKPDDEGSYNFEVRKAIGRAVHCRLNANYVVPQRNYKGPNGELNYNLNCFFQQ